MLSAVNTLLVVIGYISVVIAVEKYFGTFIDDKLTFEAMADAVRKHSSICIFMVFSRFLC